MQPPHLLELPTDLLRLILSSYVACSPLSRVTARFVCRRFCDLLPPLSQETLKRAREFCNRAALAGRAPMGVPGMCIPVPMLLKVVILGCCSGYAPTDVPGMRVLATFLLFMVILRCYNGHAPMDVPGMRALVTLLLRAVISRCCSGPSQTVVHLIGITYATKQR